MGAGIAGWYKPCDLTLFSLKNSTRSPRVGLKLLGASMDWPAALLIAKKDGGQPAGEFGCPVPEGHLARVLGFLGLLYWFWFLR